LTYDSLPALQSAAADPDPLVRMAAADTSEALPPPVRPMLAAHLLGDPALGVRLAAASSLAGVPRDGLTPGQRVSLDSALAEYRATQEANLDTAAAQLNLGVLALELGDQAAAERYFRAAIRVEPYFVPAYVNLADLYRAQSRDGEGEELLRKAIAVAPDQPGAHHALGLLLVRRGRKSDAIVELKRAVELAPDEARYAHVLGIALHSTGDTNGALEVLRAANQRKPADRDLLYDLATISRDAGDLDAARRWAGALYDLDPSDEQVRGLVEQLRSPS
jgi:tetratricopeptide (TPR) repeat protein